MRALLLIGGWLWLSGLGALAQVPGLPPASYPVTITSVPAGAEVVLPPKRPLGRAGAPLVVDFPAGVAMVRLELKLPSHQPEFLELDRFQAGAGRPNRTVYLQPDNAWVALADSWQEHPRLWGALGLMVLLGLAAGAVLGPRIWQFYRRGRRLESLKRRAQDQREGTRLGPYRLTQKIGSGGMGTVYRAVPEDTLEESQAVAVKLLQEHIANDPDSLRRLHREVQVHKLLTHPSINALLGVGEDEGTHYLVLDLLEGQPLSALIPPGGLEPAQAWSWLEPVLEAVAWAHEKHGVIHRDLKPENVMVTRQGQVKVLDFGLARAATSEKITVTGYPAGTPPYMSLEQLAGCEPMPSMDQYALGVIAYELLSGRRPFEGSFQDIVNGRLNSEPTPLGAHRPLPTELEQTVMRMVAREAEDRFPSVRAAAIALRAAFSSDPAVRA